MTKYGSLTFTNVNNPYQIISRILAGGIALSLLASVSGFYTKVNRPVFGHEPFRIREFKAQPLYRGAKQSGTRFMTGERRPQRSSRPVPNPNTQKSQPKTNKAHFNRKNGTKKTAMPKKLAEAIQLNKSITLCDTPADVLSLFVKAGGARNTGGNGALNSVNFSTMLHRIAKQSSVTQGHQSKMQQRKEVLTDLRFSILLCAIAESLAKDLVTTESKTKLNKFFKSRELSNISWGLAKLHPLSPPKQGLKVTRYQPPSAIQIEDAKLDSFVNYVQKTDPLAAQLESTSQKLRLEIVQMATLKKQGTTVTTSYLSTLRLLSGLILDGIATSVLDTESIAEFNTQEFANLLWAFATVKRGDEMFAEIVVQRLMARAELNKTQTGVTSFQKDQQSFYEYLTDIHGMKPQEVSNTIWALATMEVRGPQQVAFVEHTAKLMEDDEFLSAFKPQELSNTAWGVVTLLSKRPDRALEDNVDSFCAFIDSDTSDMIDSNDDLETEAVHRILRRVLSIITDNPDDFKSQEVSNTLWACSTTKFGSTTSGVKQEAMHDALLMTETLANVAVSAEKRLQTFLPQELNNLAWSYARLLEPVTVKSPAKGKLNEQNRHFYDILLRAKEESTKLFQGIGQEIMQRRERFAPQDIGTTLWAYATLGYFSAADVDTMPTVPKSLQIPNIDDIYRAGSSIVQIIGPTSFKPQELSNSLWALATAGMIPKYLDAFDTTMKPLKNGRAETNISYILDDPITMCFGAAAMELSRRPFEFKEQEVKDTLWSFSKVGMRHPDLFRSVALHLIGEAKNGNAAETSRTHRGLDQFTPQGLGNLAWSFAKQAGCATEMLASEELDNEKSSSSNGRLAVYETSCLDLGEELVTRFFANIAQACLSNPGGLDIFKPQDLSNVAWSFATLGLLHEKFFAAVAEEAAHRLRTCPPPRHRGDATGTTPLNMPFKPQEMANLVWSFATLNFRAPEMLDAMADYIVAGCKMRNGEHPTEEKVASLFNRQELANIAWSCAVLEKYPPELMPILYTGLIGKDEDPEQMRQVMKDSGLQRQSIRTLYYVQLLLDFEAPYLGLKLPDNFPEGWGERGSLHTSWENANDNPSLELNPSRTQSAVSKTLHRMGINHVEEFILNPPYDFLSIDIANSEELWGVEVDGPAHFVIVLDKILSSDKKEKPIPDLPEPETSKVVYRGKRRRMSFRWEWNDRNHENGPTILKHRLLCHLGWWIAHLPFWEWNSVAGDPEKEFECLNNLLEEVRDTDSDFENMLI